MRFLRREDVQHMTGLATSTIYEKMAAGTFPKPIRVTPRRVAWLEADVREWQRAILAAAGREAA
jgi:prophage regulatory protein